MALDVKYLRGSKKRYEEYLKAGKIISTNFYYLDDEQLYLGTIKLSNQDDIQQAIQNLELTISGDYATKAELNSVTEELALNIDNNAYEINLLQSRVEVLENADKSFADEVATQISELDLRIATNTNDIVNLKTDIATLQTISSGIGGKGEPPTIVTAIETAESDVMAHVDEVTSWKTL